MCKSLKELIIQEIEFQVKALETVQEVSYSKSKKAEFNAARQFQEYPRTFYGRSNTNSETFGGFCIPTDHVEFLVG